MNILELIGKLGVYHALSMMVIGQMLMIGMPMKGSPKGEDAPLIDTLLHIREVVVTARQPFHEVIPVQRLKGERLQQLNSQSVADALRYFSGLQIKDYGGVGGIKTVNIRSMGTNHLGIFYDGMELGNAQNGQTDLGQYSLDNVEEIALYNGQKSDILQSAADYAKAGTVYIRTRQPQFAEGESRPICTYRANGVQATPSAYLPSSNSVSPTEPLCRSLSADSHPMVSMSSDTKERTSMGRPPTTPQQ